VAAFSLKGKGLYLLCASLVLARNAARLSLAASVKILIQAELRHEELYLFVSLELNSGVACTASVVGGWVGFWGEQSNAVLRGSATLCERCDLAIQASFPPQEKHIAG